MFRWVVAVVVGLAILSGVTCLGQKEPESHLNSYGTGNPGTSTGNSVPSSISKFIDGREERSWWWPFAPSTKDENDVSKVPALVKPETNHPALLSSKKEPSSAGSSPVVLRSKRSWWWPFGTRSSSSDINTEHGDKTDKSKEVVGKNPSNKAK